MDIGPGTWGSLGDMTTLGQRGNSLLTDLDPARVRAHLSHCHCISLPGHCWAAPYSRIRRGNTQAWMLAECSSYRRAARQRKAGRCQLGVTVTCP